MGTKEKIEIKSLSGTDWRCVTISDEEIFVHIFFQETTEKPGLFTSDSKILQESRFQNWGKGIEVRFDRSNYGLNNTAKDHLHIYKKGNHLFAINRDGTGHDRTSQIQIPRGIADRLRQDYPDFIIPENNFVESVESLQMEEIEEILYLLELQ